MPFKNRTNLKYINMKNIFMLTNKSERKIGGKRFSVIYNPQNEAFRLFRTNRIIS